MITLPSGFDYALLLSDFFVLSLPFVGISALFLAYRIINKSFRGV